jgi:hypothetical protein
VELSFGEGEGRALYGRVMEEVNGNLNQRMTFHQEQLLGVLIGKYGIEVLDLKNNHEYEIFLLPLKIYIIVNFMSREIS